MSSNMNGSKTHFHGSLRQDFKNNDITFLQEIKPQNIQTLKRLTVLATNELRATIIFECTLPGTPEHLSPQGNPGSTHQRGGVGNFHSPQVQQEYQFQRFSLPTFDNTKLQNRYLCLLSNITTTPTYLHCIYAPVEPNQKQSFFEALPGPACFPGNSTHIVGGDFNFSRDSILDCSRNLRHGNDRIRTAFNLWLTGLELTDSWRQEFPDSRLHTAISNRVDYILASTHLYGHFNLKSKYVPKSKFVTGDHDAAVLNMNPVNVSVRSGFWKCPIAPLRQPEIQHAIKQQAQTLLEALDTNRNALAQWSKFKRKSRIFL